MIRPPPDAALTVGGRITAATRAALEEARRIQAGWEAALEEAQQAQAEAAASTLAATLEALERWRLDEQRRLTRQAVALAQALAERLIGEAIETDPEATLAALVAAVPPIAPSPGPWLALAVAPATAQALEGRLPPGVRLVQDPTLPVGAARLSDPPGAAALAEAIARLCVGP